MVLFKMNQHRYICPFFMQLTEVNSGDIIVSKFTDWTFIKYHTVWRSDYSIVAERQTNVEVFEL